MDGRTLTDFMHTRGLRMRSLGQVVRFYSSCDMFFMHFSIRLTIAPGLGRMSCPLDVTEVSLAIWIKKSLAYCLT